MAERRNRYKQFESNMTLCLIGDLALFLLYMLFASMGIIWLKIILAIFCGLLSLGLLGILFLNQELTRPRSLWMTVAAASIAVCLLTSLLLNYPAL